MERINVIRTLTYEVESARQAIRDENSDQAMEVSDEDVIELVTRWAEEDMMHPPSRHDIVFQDENGEEL